MGSQTHYNLENKLACLYNCHDFSSIDYEDLVELEHELELSLTKLRARKVFVHEDIPVEPGVCRVGGALFMVGGYLKRTELSYDGSLDFILNETKWLWSAPAPPIAAGDSFTMTWTRCDTAMDSERLFTPLVRRGKKQWGNLRREPPRLSTW